MSRFEVLAINDEKDFCECCGRTGLRRVVWIEDHETGEIKHFGTTCAVAPAKGFYIEREVKEAIKKLDERAKIINAMVFKAYRAAGGQYGPPNEKGVFPCLDPELRASIHKKISAEMA